MFPLKDRCCYKRQVIGYREQDLLFTRDLLVNDFLKVRQNRGRCGANDRAALELCGNGDPGGRDIALGDAEAFGIHIPGVRIQYFLGGARQTLDGIFNQYRRMQRSDNSPNSEPDAPKLTERSASISMQPATVGGWPMGCAGTFRFKSTFVPVFISMEALASMNVNALSFRAISGMRWAETVPWGEMAWTDTETTGGQIDILEGEIETAVEAYSCPWG
jgi:hypothetical protein